MLVKGTPLLHQTIFFATMHTVPLLCGKTVTVDWFTQLTTHSYDSTGKQYITKANTRQLRQILCTQNYVVLSTSEKKSEGATRVLYTWQKGCFSRHFGNRSAHIHIPLDVTS
jgi:hypothetical protein